MLMYIYFIIFPHFLFEACYSNVKTFGESNNLFYFFCSARMKKDFYIVTNKK